MRVMKMSWPMFAIVVLLAGACGSSNNPPSTGTAGTTGGAGSGRGGTTGGAGTSGAAGAAGTSGNAGTTGRGGTTGSAGATGTGGAGGQPLGAICANSSNCSQADGPAVCCLSIPACVPEGQCPGSPNFVPCTDTASCNKGGWICCNAGGMHFCTKQSGCPAP
jgi:hypothetical protein